MTTDESNRSSDRVDPQPPAPSDVDRLAAEWMDAVVATGLTSLDRSELAPRFVAFTADVLSAVRDGPLDPTAPQQVGAALVALHVTEPAALARTLAVLGERLAGHPAGAGRVAQVLGALAAGFTQAVRDRTRHEQELITASAFSARSAAETARRESDARFEAVFTDAAIGIAVCDVGGAVLEVNRSLCAMLGYDARSLTNRTFREFVHPDDSPGFWARIDELVAGTDDHARMEKPVYRRDGTPIWTDVVVTLVRTPDGRPRYLVAMVDDVTHYHELRARLLHNASHDPLTGLANRTLFFDRLETALAAGAPVGVCYLDLDGFKTVNDTLGHDQGDVLLCAVAERLDQALGPAGHLVVRMGGDEFVVFVERAVDAEQLREVASVALRTVRRPVRLGGHEIAASASIGIVRRGDGGPGAAALMRAADTTMYWAKRDGGDRIARFDAARHRRDLNRSTLSARLPEAIAHGEFVLDYQPLVRLADGAVTGVEALVRWLLPSGERLGPDEFIGLAEDTGQIVGLGRSVLEQACRTAAAWHAADPRVRPLLSVNLAARQLHERGLLTDVTRILDDTGWPAELLQLELTESDLTATTHQSISTLRALAAAGVRIAIDDFGTGYSNLAYLRHLPIHTLKLAGPFVTGAPHGSAGLLAGPDGGGSDEVDLAVVELVTELAHALGMTVVAESVETDKQYRHLRDLGCDTGQGWYFAPPVAPGAVPDLVRGTVQALPTSDGEPAG